jgi:hypothetical protein
METANYLRNRSLNASLDGKTPYEALYSVKPDVSHLRIIESLVYTHIPKEKRLKHESHINLGIFVGYTDTDRFIKVYDPLKRTIKSYRDVVIDETLRWSTRLCHNLLGCLAVYASWYRRGMYCKRKHGSQLP